MIESCFLGSLLVGISPLAPVAWSIRFWGFFLTARKEGKKWTGFWELNSPENLRSGDGYALDKSCADKF